MNRKRLPIKNTGNAEVDERRYKLLTSFHTKIRNQNKGKRFNETIKIVEGKKILDFGCNVGFTSYELAKKNFNVIGIDYLQSQIDTIAELLRTIGEYMPSEIQFVLNESTISTAIFEGDSIDLISGVRNDLEVLKGFYEDLMQVAEDEGYQEIANYCQDRILALNKHIWMLDATLE